MNASSRRRAVSSKRNRKLLFQSLEPHIVLSDVPYLVDLPEPSGGSQSGFVSGGEAGTSAPTSDEYGPLAPGLDTTIEGINFDENAANSGSYSIPPDPIGAAGLAHVLSVVNTSIEWHLKDGTQQFSDQLEDFFAPQFFAPVNNTFDPKVIYDQHAGRFVVVTLERTDDGDSTATGDAGDSSRILVAVSDDSDPNGTWSYFAINAKTTIGGIDRWADYPGFAVDEEAIYITNNMFRFGPTGTFGGVRLWIIPKGIGTGDSTIAAARVRSRFTTRTRMSTALPPPRNQPTSTARGLPEWEHFWLATAG